MAEKRPVSHTVGSVSFNPDCFFEQWSSDRYVPQQNDLRLSIIQNFGLAEDDNYIYHAIVAVDLDGVQAAINQGGAGGLHAWYTSDDGTAIAGPPQADVEAYIDIFQPDTSTTKQLSGLGANAKRGSLRGAVAAHLTSKLHLPDRAQKIVLEKRKSKDFKNPYLDVWAWTCRNLQWVGPVPETHKITTSHHVLPVLYHHFGCVCPTYDALKVIEQLSRSKTIAPLGKTKRRIVVEAGSGNGYWTYMLRRLGIQVLAVDNGWSSWRTMWIEDTIVMDALDFIKQPPFEHKSVVGLGAENSILLLVYPQVSGNYTSKLLNTYEGNVIVIAGTQNSNGYTGFIDQTIEQWMAKNRCEFEKIMQIPLPSFAGKDEALIVFCRKNTV